MKNSGIEWIGEIPDNWKIGKIKNICRIFGRIGFRGYRQEDLVSAGEGAITLSPSNMKDMKMDYNKCTYLSWDKYFESPEIQIENGDILFVKTGSTFGKVALVEKLPLEATINPQIIVIKDIGISNKFLCYFLSTDIIRSQINCSVVGGTIPTIAQEKILNYILLIPEIQQSKQIADALDEKCGKIDKLIENEQKQIEKMKEYKQSVITSAVTKGLDPTAPMKDSGIEYFEMIPVIWETAKTLNVLETPITDGPHTTPNLYEDGIPFISAEAIKNGKINFELKRGYISQEFYDECCLKYIPKLHDIYMIKSGATTGNVACVETEEIFTIWSPLAVFRCNEKLMKYRYLYYFLQSKPYQQQIQLKWSFGTQQNIGMRVLETLKLLIPPIEEQKEIADYLDEKCGKIDEVISIKQRKIEKLQEYKKSLIYEYVTGKKEVV